MKRKGIFAIAIAGAVVLVSVIAYQVQSAPIKQRVALHTALVNNLVILDSTQFVSTDMPTAALQHQTIAAKLEESLQKLEAASKSPLNDKQVGHVERLITAERKTLKTYVKNTNILYKILTYNPIDDIGRLKSGDELTTRAKAASTGIDAVLQKDIGQKLTIVENEISLSSAAHSSLEVAKDCFDQLAVGHTTVSKCVKLYGIARQTLNSDLQDLWATTEINQLSAQTSAIME